MRVGAALAGIVVAGLTFGPAAAADLAQGEALYRAGHLYEAARLGRSLRHADGFALAAKALLVEAVYLAADDQKVEILRRAASDARAALRLDPDHVGAHLQVALALGYIAEADDALTAHLEGLAVETKMHLDRALELAPADPWANGLLGIWHLRLVARGTSALAGQLYGATEAEGRGRCRRAVAFEPPATAVHYGCAVSLLELDADRYRELAAGMLDTVVAASAADLAARLVRRNARRLLEQLKPGSTG